MPARSKILPIAERGLADRKGMKAWRARTTVAEGLIIDRSHKLAKLACCLLRLHAAQVLDERQDPGAYVELRIVGRVHEIGRGLYPVILTPDWHVTRAVGGHGAAFDHLVEFREREHP